MHKGIQKLLIIGLSGLLALSPMTGCARRPGDSSAPAASGGSLDSGQTGSTGGAGLSTAEQGAGSAAGTGSTGSSRHTVGGSTKKTTGHASGKPTSTTTTKQWGGSSVTITDGFSYGGVKPNNKKAALTKSSRQYTGEIVYYDLSGEIKTGQTGYDLGFLLLALQGLVNRDKPQMYLNVKSTSVSGPQSTDVTGWVQGVSPDPFWLTYLTGPGQYLEKAKIKTYAGDGVDVAKALLEKFKSYYKGVVVWDPNVAATSLVAATIAGADNLLPVRYDTAGNSLYTLLVKTLGMKVQTDLTGKFTGKAGSTVYGTSLKSTGSAKNDAYLYAKVNYLDAGKTSKSWMGHFEDAYPQSLYESGLEVYAGTISFGVDFLISQKAFLFDLCQFPDVAPLDDPKQPKGTDYDTFNQILTSQYKRAGGAFFHVMGWDTWKTGYEDGFKYDGTMREFHYIQLISQYNGRGECNANAANASVFQHVPEKSSYKQKGNTQVDMSKYDPNKQYVMFYLGDFDSTQWLEDYLPCLWENANRGKLPIAWNIDGAQADSCRAFFNYLYDTATPNDYFVAGNNGAGYLNVEFLEADKKDPKYAGKVVKDGVDAWKAYCKQVYAKYDLSITPFLIITNGAHWSDRIYKAFADFSPNGFGYWNHEEAPPIRLITNSAGQQVPMVKRANGVTNLNSEEEFYNLLRGYLTDSKYAPMKGMFALNTTIVSPGTIVSVVEKLRKNNPNLPFEVVDPYTFYAYAKRRVQ